MGNKTENNTDSFINNNNLPTPLDSNADNTDSKNNSSHTLAYFCDNKNFKNEEGRVDRKKSSVSEQPKLQVIDNQIVVGTRVEENQEENDIVTSMTYIKNRTTRAKWTKKDLSVLYSGLELCGYDYSLLESLFKNKTRRNIKDKVRSEMKKHPKKVNKALNSKIEFDEKKFQELKEGFID